MKISWAGRSDNEAYELCRRVRRQLDGCWIWAGKPGDVGYGTWQWHGKADRAHRVAYRLFVGPIPKGLCVCHHCDVRLCVNPAHLFLGTRAENMADMDAKGRRVTVIGRGEKNRNAKLTLAQVQEARQLAGKVSIRALARSWGVSHTALQHAIRGTNWRDL